MDFPDRFPLDGVHSIRFAAAETSDAAHGNFSDELGALIGFPIQLYAVWAMDLVVGQNTVLEDEPSGTPSAAVVNPLVERAGDAVSDDVVESELGGFVEGDADGGEVCGERWEARPSETVSAGGGCGAGRGCRGCGAGAGEAEDGMVVGGWGRKGVHRHRMVGG